MTLLCNLADQSGIGNTFGRMRSKAGETYGLTPFRVMAHPPRCNAANSKKLLAIPSQEKLAASLLLVAYSLLPFLQKYVNTIDRHLLTPLQSRLHSRDSVSHE
jgi:hypothetical protein